ncbi:MAG: SDR family oxidoreductase [Candidatus Omnitrophota bacterium]
MNKITKKNILITGANGFIGRNLCAFLKEKDYSVRAAVRSNVNDVFGVEEYVQIGDINDSTDWKQALSGVDTVIHLAAHVHVMDNPDDGSLEEFRKVNVLGTERLALLSANAGVKRFIFISSVKVNGERKSAPYCEDDIADPQDAYGISKLEAENILKKIANETDLQIVILRIPMVYGPGVKANFKSLIKIAGSGIPLPFKGINNRRSLLYVGNLVDAISICVYHPKAMNEIFLLSDGQDVSTSDLIRIIACAMDKKVRLFFFPPVILKTLFTIMGKAQAWDKLAGSLFVDNRKIRNLLSWKLPFTLEEGLRETIKLYK